MPGPPGEVRPGRGERMSDVNHPPEACVDCGRELNIGMKRKYFDRCFECGKKAEAEWEAKENAKDETANRLAELDDAVNRSLEFIGQTAATKTVELDRKRYGNTFIWEITVAWESGA